MEVNLEESDGGDLEDGLNNSDGSCSQVEEDGEPDEFFDVLDILDGRADPFNDESPATPSGEGKSLHASSEEEEQEEEVDYDGGHHDMDTEEVDQLTPSDDEAEVDALHRLGQFVSGLDSSGKRKISEGEGVGMAENNTPYKKRKLLLLKERNEAGAENEFAVSGELEYDQRDVPPHYDTSALQVTPNSISRIFSLRL